ncbi:MAG: hypothetical protein QXV17_03105 [Candidatus Micrarchaeaceae archaeon]
MSKALQHGDFTHKSATFVSGKFTCFAVSFSKLYIVSLILMTLDLPPMALSGLAGVFSTNPSFEGSFFDRSFMLTVSPRKLDVTTS